MKGILLSLAIFSVLSVSAQECNEGDTLSVSELWDLSIDDLLEVKVSVATKHEEQIALAPASISVYQAGNINALGYYTLKELADFTTGYSSFSIFGETNLETRGQKSDSWNVSKHLLLVDGIPVSHARANSIPLEYQFPLFFADRIEFMKGPGSALYGNSAFYGAININSHSLPQNGFSSDFRFSYGTVGEEQRLAGNAIMKRKSGQLKLHFTHYKRGFSGDGLGLPSSNAHFDNANSSFLYLTYRFDQSVLKGLELGSFYMSRNSHGGEFWGAPASPNNWLQWEYLIPFIKYQNKLSPNLSLQSYIKFNASTEKALTSSSRSNRIFKPGSIPASGYDITTTNVEYMVEFNYKVNEKSNLIAGINYDTKKELGDPVSFRSTVQAPEDTSFTIPYDYRYDIHYGTIRTHVASVYAQYQKEFSLLHGLLLTLGARYDHGFNEVGNFNQISPRIGLVQRVTPSVSVKALYGTALLVPGVKEYGFNANTLDSIRANGGTGNVNDIPDMQAETFMTFEGGISIQHQKLSIEMTAFYNETNNALEFVLYDFVNEEGEDRRFSYFRNSNEQIKAQGFETELHYLPNKNLRIICSHAFAHAKLNDTIDFTYVPTHKTNAAISYSLSGNYKASVTLISRNVWGVRVPEGVFDHPDLDISSDNILKGYHLIDLNMHIPITQQAELEIQARNLLNNDWKQPSVLGQHSMIPLKKQSLLFTLILRL